MVPSALEPRPSPMMPSMAYAANSDEALLARPKVRVAERELKWNVSLAVVPETVPVPYVMENFVLSVWILLLVKRENTVVPESASTYLQRAGIAFAKSGVLRTGVGLAILAHDPCVTRRRVK